MLKFTKECREFLQKWAAGLTGCGHNCSDCVLNMFDDETKKCADNARELLAAIEEYNRNHETKEEREKRQNIFVENCLHVLGINKEEIAAHDAEIAGQEQKEAEARKQQRYEEAAPRRYWTESLDTYKTETEQQKKALDIVRRFVDVVRGGRFRALALLGPAGTGKTHLACGALRECGGKFYNASELGERMHRAHGFSTKETECEILAECCDCDLLVIDEIGRGSSRDDEQYALYKIINERYNLQRCTLLVSNLQGKEFYNFLGTAAVDRLTECGGVFEFTPDTKSYRNVLRGGK